MLINECSKILDKLIVLIVRNSTEDRFEITTLKVRGKRVYCSTVGLISPPVEGKVWLAKDPSENYSVVLAIV
jgi:hypothetical protein